MSAETLHTINVTELEALAIQALRDVATDSKATPAARAQASRTLLEFTKAVGSGAKTRTNSSPDPSEMTADQLAQSATNSQIAVDPFG